MDEKNLKSHSNLYRTGVSLKFEVNILYNSFIPANFAFLLNKIPP